MTRVNDTAEHGNIYFTVFPNQRAQSKKAYTATLDALRDGILQQRATEKTLLPWLKLARFGNKASDTGCLRNDDNVIEITGIELDYDGALISLDQASNAITSINLKCLIYTTPSHTDAAPKWRIIAPTSRPLPPSERERLARGVDALFGHIFDEASFRLSQSYYYGSVSDNGSPNAAHRCHVFDGDFVDEIDLPMVEAKAPTNGSKVAKSTTPEIDTDDPNLGLNSLALANLGAWVLELFSSARRSGDGYRVSSASLGRDLEEDISFTPQGIKDFGVHDMGDPNGGKRTPVAIVMEWKRCDESAAIRWLCERLGVPVDDGPPFSEENIAIEFAKRNADSVRYVARFGQWFTWNGACWREDEKRSVYTAARNVCRETAIRSNKSSERKRIASAKTRAAVVSLAGEDPRLAATADQWDTDPWLLNTPDGVVNLRTGQMRAQRPEDYMTKCTTVSPGADCPKWKKFLEEVTGENKELKNYLQRVGGYCLTGVTDEQELYFFYGTGRNGKSVFLKTIATILGDYHRASSIETFTVSQSDRHPTEVAGLRGARLVTATETEDGRRWSEARIKELTGGDKVSARFMHQDFFDFTPQFKLLFCGNHMPALRTVNQAIRRRFRRVPFTVTISEEKVNVRLAEELMEEAPGILQWLIEGCLEWQRDGLKPPKAVTEATEAYLESQDVLGDWLAECCDVGNANHTETSARLFGSWKEWCEARNEFVGSKKAFGSKLEDHGFEPRKGGQGVRYFSGLRLKP
jgi:putative DNA primase/helicase